jgi:hypothetical protein
VWCLGWRDKGRALCYCQTESFDVRTATTFPESRAWHGPRRDTSRPSTEHDTPGDSQRQLHWKDGPGLAAAAIVVCAGAVLRVPWRAGDGAALVDADMGPQYVYSGSTTTGSGAL